ncbi:MAG: type II toxin-antitoxin system Phd/YefM family antitoxin [Chloroflexota bacterium]
MARVIGVEEARTKLGQLAEDVSAGSEPVVLTKRGHLLAVLLSREAYDELAALRRERARSELRQRVGEIRQGVQSATLDPSAVDEAVEANRPSTIASRQTAEA